MFKSTLYAFFFIFCIASCTTRKTTYFVGQETENIKTKYIEPEQSVIQKNDLLSIKVSSLNPNASAVFNAGPENSMTSTNAGATSQAFGYLVDIDGNIQLPVLGNIRAAGLTTKILKDTISYLLTAKNLLRDPVVAVRFLNFKISVLGEVARPSVYNIPGEKVTLLEALAMAGDLTIYSKYKDVLLIREENGEKKLVRLDLSSSEIFSSPYYYLKSNDIVYVEHNRSKVANSRPIGPWLGAFFSFTSLVVVIITSYK